MKPNVVLFGEMLPWQTMKAAQKHTRAADLMLVIGTSLEVAPAGDLPELARKNGAKLIFINHAETHFDNLADILIRGDVADVLPRLAEPFQPQPDPDEPSVQVIYREWSLGKNPPLGDVNISS
jgi:NAD-dependent deacetylase